MATKIGLSKAEIAARDALVEKLSKARGDLEDAVNTYNEASQQAHAKLEASIAGYNAVVQEAEAFRMDVHDDAESMFDERSERWRESDAAEPTSEFIAAWGGVEFSELDEVDAHEVDIEDIAPENIGETLADLPVAPERD